MYLDCKNVGLFGKRNHICGETKNISRTNLLLTLEFQAMSSAGLDSLLLFSVNYVN